MALVRAVRPLDLLSPLNEGEKSWGQDAGAYRITREELEIRLIGEFQYNGSVPAGGTVARVEIANDDGIAGRILGTSFAFDTANVYDPARGDAQLIFRAALAGDDEIYGSDFDDRLGGFDGNDYIDGGRGNDVMFGGDGDDYIVSGAGSNIIDGGNGLDVAAYPYERDFYLFERHDAEFTITRTIGHYVDQLTNMERVVFSDGVLAFDDHAAQAYRLYQAAFDRVPDRDGLSYWVEKLDDGAGLYELANHFVSSPEFSDTYGSVSNAELVEIFYDNILDRGSDPAGFDYWLGRLDGGASRAEVLANFSESPENIAQVADAIYLGIWLNPEVTIFGA